MFKIGDFSKLCRVPVSALRYYADIGLLPPAHVDPFTGYRYYSLDQLPRLNRILALKDLNLSLEQITQLVNDKLDAAEIRGILRLKQTELEQQIGEEQARLARVAARLKQIEQEGKMPTYEVILKTIETQHVMAMRKIFAQPADVGKIYAEAYPVLMSQNIMPIAPPFTIFHDPEFKPENLDAEAVFPIADTITTPITLPNGDTCRIYDLPGVNLAASLLYEGSYDNLTEPYTAIGQWIEGNGYQIAGAPREIYLRPPSATETALTEILYPVAKISA